jgi:hypothetical protein
MGKKEVGFGELKVVYKPLWVTCLTSLPYIASGVWDGMYLYSGPVRLWCCGVEQIFARHRVLYHTNATPQIILTERGTRLLRPQKLCNNMAWTYHWSNCQLRWCRGLLRIVSIVNPTRNSGIVFDSSWGEPSTLIVFRYTKYLILSCQYLFPWRTTVHDSCYRREIAQLHKSCHGEQTWALIPPIS